MATYQKHQPHPANEAAQKRSPFRSAPVQSGPLGLLLIAALLAGCGGAPAATQIPPPVAAPTQPPATPTAQPSPTPLPPTPTAVPSPTAAPAASAGSFKPLDSAACGDLTTAMGQTLGVEAALADAPFQDYVTGQAGTGCQAAVAGSGWDFVTVTQSLWAMLAAQGWQTDPMYDADGPTGAVRGFRQGDGLCLLTVEWKPSPDANCPPDKPISDCQLKPEQRLYSISLNCARDASSQP
jgi:hypothetical protein